MNLFESLTFAGHLSFEHVFNNKKKAEETKLVVGKVPTDVLSKLHVNFFPGALSIFVQRHFYI